MKSALIARPVALFFFLGLLWTAFLNQGLTIGDHDDWDHVLFANDVSWKPLAAQILKPWSSSPFWHGQGSFTDHVLNERVFATFYLKIIVSVFSPAKTFFVFFFYKSIPFVLTLSLLAFILRRNVADPRIAFGACLFYILIPVHYLHVLWISDPATLVIFFIMLSIPVFLKINSAFERRDHEKMPKLFLALFFILWLAIKTKSTALIAPMIYSAYALLSFNRWFRADPKNFFVFLLGCALIAFQIIPIEHLGNHSPGKPFSLENISKFLFFNPDSIFGRENAPAWMDPSIVFPASMARVFGFFLIWPCVIFILIAALFLKNRFVKIFWKSAIVKLSLLWLLFEIPLMGIFLVESRYFSGTFIPVILLISKMIDCVTLELKAVWIKKTLLTLSLAGLLISCGINFKHILWFKGEIESRYFQTFQMSKAIYENLFPGEVIEPDKIGRFYAMMYQPNPESPHIQKVLARTVYGIPEWGKTQSLKNSSQWDLIASNGFCYDITQDKNAWPSDTAFVIAEVSAWPPTSMYQGIMNKLKPSKSPSLYIYKHNRCALKT